MPATETIDKPKAERRPSKLFETSVDSEGHVTLKLSKPAATALAKARDVCDALHKAAPTVKAQAQGARDILNRLMGDIARGLDLNEQHESAG